MRALFHRIRSWLSKPFRSTQEDSYIRSKKPPNESLVIVILILISSLLLITLDFNRFRIKPVEPIHVKNTTLFKIAQEFVNKDRSFTKKPGNIKLIPTHKTPCWKEGSDIRCLPAFYLAGFPKCSTTDLWRELTKHPDILTPDPRTQNIFAKEFGWWNLFRFKTPFDNYIDKFSLAALFPKKIIGDGTPTTLFDNRVISTWRWSNPPASSRLLQALENYEVLPPHLILQFTPHAKFIVVVREPAIRLYSHFLHEHSNIKQPYPEPIEFHHLVKTAIDNYKTCLLTHSMRYCAYDIQTFDWTKSDWIYLHMGMYAVFIKDALKLIPRENLFIVHNDEYITKNKSRILFNIFKFLGVESRKENLNLVFGKAMTEVKSGHASKGHPMWRKTEKLLSEFYRPFNEELAGLMKDPRYLFEK